MSGEGRGQPPPALLCAVNFGSGTGFAWTFIERIYADVASRLAEKGIDTWVAYPELEVDPEPLERSPARPVELPIRPGNPTALWHLARMVRQRNIKVIYLPDRATWHPGYAVLRAAGVSWIVVHDHTSGARTRPKGVRRALKGASRGMPGMLADRVIGVSDFVARRKVDVDLVPADRVVRVWNGIRVPARRDGATDLMKARLDLPAGRPVIASACRAAEEKGVQHLIRAFARVVGDASVGQGRPVLVYMGEGPALEAWKALAVELGVGDDVIFTGYREDADELVGDAAVAVVPSVWAEAFGLAALEPMARGVPVIASRVGGLPEVVVDGETGLLVSPGDESALAGAIRRLLGDEEERREMGRRARERVEEHFSWEEQIGKITALLQEGFA